MPKLQKRGIFWEDNAVPGGTMRENFYAKEGQWQLPDDHPSAQFRWNAKMKEEDPLEGLRWPPMAELVKVKASDDPLEGCRWIALTKKEDPLEGLRWQWPSKAESMKAKVSDDPLEGLRWNPAVTSSK